MSDEVKLISVGEIVNTHGVRGDVRVYPLTDFPERFKKNGVFLLEKDNTTRHLTIDSAKPHKNLLLVKFKEIDDMDSAEGIKGGLLKVPREQLTELPPDTYYVFDIIGMEVVTEEGLKLGTVSDVVQTGSNDVYVVKGTEKEYLIPALKEVVKSIDKSGGQILIRPLDGLLDL